MRLTRDRILGCLAGGAIGDALGGAYEGASAPVEVDWSLPWSLSDDTQLTLATCEAIADSGGVDPASIAAAFLRWFRAGRLTGLGAATTKALRELDQGIHWALVGRRGEMAAGNGAAMRAAPLAFFLNPDLDEDRVLIRDVCRITHHNDEAYAGALAVILAVRSALAGEPVSTSATGEQLPDCAVRDRLFELSKCVELAAAARFGCSGHVVDSAPLAIYAVERSGSAGLRLALERIVELGGDTDTNASIAGQILGAAMGYERLDRDLVEQVPALESILSIGDRLKRLNRP